MSLLLQCSDQEIEAFDTVSDISAAVHLALAAKPTPIASMQTS